MFSCLVDRLGLGKFTQDDYNMLSARNWEMLGEKERDQYKTALYSCSTNDNAKIANYRHLKTLGKPVATTNAVNELNIVLR